MTELIPNKEHILTDLALLTSSKDIDKLKTILISTEPQILYDAAIQHGVVGLAYKNIKNSINTSDYLAFINQLNNYSNNYKILNNFIDAEAINVLKQLQKEKIDVVVMKGFSLGYQVYPEPSLRPKTDIDIITNPKDSEKLNNHPLKKVGSEMRTKVLSSSKN